MLKRLFNNKSSYIYLDNELVKGWHKCSFDEYCAWAQPYDGSCDEELHWCGPKIPMNIMQDALGLIKYFKNKEVMICLYFSKKDKQWIAECPEQRGSGASVTYDSTFEPPKGYIFCGTIHSHPQMSAFWSGTDRNDQGAKNGLHIVVGTDAEGNLKSYLCSLWYNKQCYDANDQVELPQTAGEAPADWIAKIKDSPLSQASYPTLSIDGFKVDDKKLLEKYTGESTKTDQDQLNYYLYGNMSDEDKLNDVVWLLESMGYADLAAEVESKVLADISDSEVSGGLLGEYDFEELLDTNVYK